MKYASSNRNTNTVTDMESDIKDALSNQNEGVFGNRPVYIHIHSVRKRPTDPDGVSGKAAIDAIVKAGVLPDDNCQIVKSVTFSQEKGVDEQTVITISDE